MAREPLAPVYLFQGDDPHTVGRCLAELRRRVLAPGMEAFDHEMFEGPALSAIDPVLRALSQPPVASRRRLVELADPDKIGDAATAATKGSAAEAVRALAGYLADPNPTSVLAVHGAGIDGRSRLVRAARKHGYVFGLGPLRNDREAESYVAELARARGVDLERGAAAALVRAVGLHRAMLETALETAMLHAGGDRVATADVEAVAPATREAAVFDLTDAVGAGDVGRALSVLRSIFAERAMPERSQALVLVGLLARQIRQIWTVHCHGARSGALLGLPPFVMRKLSAQAARFDTGRLRRAHRGLCRLDAALKSSDEAAVRAPASLVEAWVLDVCGVWERAPASPRVEPGTPMGGAPRSC